MMQGIDRFSGLARVVGRMGPSISLMVVVSVALLAPQPPAVDAQVMAKHDRIRRVLEAVPLRCGEWIGEEQPLAPAAVELLRPNASLSRSYRRIGSDDRAAISLIHCSDARDMAGHYPPICYPAHGWSLSRLGDGSLDGGIGTPPSPKVEDGFESIELVLRDGRVVPLRVYRFSRLGEGLAEIKMTILSAFILPDGGWGSDLGVIRDAQSRRRVSREGVAQLQVLFAGWPSTDAVTEPAKSLLGALPPAVLDVLSDRTIPGMEASDE